MIIGCSKCRKGWRTSTANTTALSTAGASFSMFASHHSNECMASIFTQPATSQFARLISRTMIDDCNECISNTRHTRNSKRFGFFRRFPPIDHNSAQWDGGTGGCGACCSQHRHCRRRHCCGAREHTITAHNPPCLTGLKGARRRCVP